MVSDEVISKQAGKALDAEAAQKTAKESNVIGKLAQLLGLMAIVSGIFGASYQKGMILSMNLGNINGNYDIRELFNSSVLGYLYMIERVLSADKSSQFLQIIYLSIPYVFVGLAFTLIYRNQNKSKELLVYGAKMFKAWVDKVLGSYILSALVGAVIGLFVNVLLFFVGYFSIIFISGVMILPALLGYIVGESRVESARGNPPCVEMRTEMLKGRFVNQCTQIKLNSGKQIGGNILLENDEAYFVHHNSTFVYLKKDEVKCLFSKFRKTEDIKNIESFKFPEGGSDIVCQPEESGLKS